MKSNRKAKNLLLNKEYQVRYVVWTTLGAFVLLLANAYSFFAYMRSTFVEMANNLPISPDMQQNLVADSFRVTVGYFITSLIFLLAIAFLTLVLTHRTVGPLYRFKKTFEAITEGERTLRIRLRPNDDFRDVAQAFNAMMDKVLPETITSTPEPNTTTSPNQTPSQ